MREQSRQAETGVKPLSSGTTPVTRVGDIAAMLRVMRPLHGAVPDPVLRRRRLLADLCRLVGVSVGTVSPSSIKDGDIRSVGLDKPIESPPQNGAELSPRLEETLRHLLDGASEKEVAHKLKLSKHTVHVYVKALYRKFNVSSRAELLAKHLKRPAVTPPQPVR